MAKIEEWAFGGCTSLQSVEIPDSVTVIGMGAFEGCSSLQPVDIPGSVTLIGGWAFSGCTSLQSVDLPDSVAEIGKWAFRGCTSFQSVDIPDSVKRIYFKAFENCADLKEIHCRMKSLKDVWIQSDLFDESIFDRCTLFVSPGTQMEYCHHRVFGKFKNIEIEFEE